MTKAPHNEKSTAYNGVSTAYNKISTAYNNITTTHNTESTTYNATTTSYNKVGTAYNDITTAYTYYNQHKAVMAFHNNDLYCSSNEFPNHLALLTMIQQKCLYILQTA